MNNYPDLYTVILAGGKGKRMNATVSNKVTYAVAGEPIIQRILKKVSSAGIENIVVVVGHAKNSVIKLLPPNVKVAHQTKRLGTGHATKAALGQIPENTKNVLVLYGDDAFWYSPEHFQELIDLHQSSDATVTFCTTNVEDPFGLGRVTRDSHGNITAIVEEKNATPEQRKIREVNVGGFVFKKEFLQKNIGRLPKNPITKEYYLTDMVDLALKQNQKVQTFFLKNFTWRGVNTPSELELAENLLLA